MSGAQLGEETLPVFRVVVDSVEALHIYVGHQPLIGTKNHVSVCIFLDGGEKKNASHCIAFIIHGNALNVHLK